MRILLILALINLLGACTSFTVQERNFIMPDSVTGKNTTTRFNQTALKAILPNANMHDVSVTQADGNVTHGIVISQPGARATLLYFGGNMFHIDRHAQEILSTIAACNVNVAMFDYRGYGRSSGKPTVALMSTDALAVYDHMNAQSLGQVMVHGQSLGSFIAAYVAQFRPARALVLESTATNPQDWAIANTPWYFRPFVSIEVAPELALVDNLVAVSAYTGPSLLLIGGQDVITPPTLANRVFVAMRGSPKVLLVAQGAGHNDVLDDTKIAQKYCEFLGKLGS